MVLVNKMAGNVLESLFLIEGDRYLWHLSLSFYLETGMLAGSGEAVLWTGGHQQEGNGKRITDDSYGLFPEGNPGSLQCSLSITSVPLHPPLILCLSKSTSQAPSSHWLSLPLPVPKSPSHGWKKWIGSIIHLRLLFAVFIVVLALPMRFTLLTDF